MQNVYKLVEKKILTWSLFKLLIAMHLLLKFVLILI